MNRKEITKEQALEACCMLNKKLLYRMNQKGRGSYASSHEILGLLYQELGEYEHAIHERKSDEDKIEELLDVAVAAVFGVASIYNKGTDW